MSHLEFVKMVTRLIQAWFDRNDKILHIKNEEGKIGTFRITHSLSVRFSSNESSLQDLFEYISLNSMKCMVEAQSSTNGSALTVFS